MSSINERFREARQSLGLSQEAFGEKIGLSRSEVKNIEYGKTTPKDFTLGLCQENHGISKDWLLDGSGDMYAVPESRNEEISRFVGKALADESEPFKRQMLYFLSKLTDEQWSILAAAAEILAEEQNASE